MADEAFYRWLIFKDGMRSPGESVYIFRRHSSIMLGYIPIFRDQVKEEKQRKDWPELVAGEYLS